MKAAKIKVTTFYMYYAHTPTRGNRQSRVYPVLSIDGGGIRGIIPAKMLVEIEKITRTPIANLFRLIGGTSTGGILALGLTKPNGNETNPEYSAQNLLELYTDENNRCQIFRGNHDYPPDTSDLDMMESAVAKIYNPKYLTPELFQRKFGDIGLGSALADVVITANTVDSVVSKMTGIGVSYTFNLISLIGAAISNSRASLCSHDMMQGKEVHLFTRNGLKGLRYSYSELEDHYRPIWRPQPLFEYESVRKPYNMYEESRGGFYMRDVAKVTSAAPTYFSPMSYKKSKFVDGGVLQNNPAIPCIFEALEKGHQEKDLFMVSLGTGIGRRESVSDLSSSVQSLWFNATQSGLTEELLLSNMLSFGAYHRFQYKFKGNTPALDAIDAITIQTLQDCGDALVESNSAYLREVCKVLSPESF